MPAVDEFEETLSFREDVTGINHTLFISPHAIRVAIDPPDNLDPASCMAASISLNGVWGEASPNFIVSFNPTKA